MNLARFGPARFAHLPTPLEPLAGLTARLSRGGRGPQVWIKRDDCTGLAGGGNKTRQLEYLVGDALALGADTLVTYGAVQSNHVRQTAAAAAKFGLACRLVLERRTPSEADEYLASGNVLLDRLLGAKIRLLPRGSDLMAAVAETVGEVAQGGGRPYLIPGGGSNAVGALGYVECALELVGQANAIGRSIDRIVVTSGSAGTQAGLVAGLAALGADIPVLGISVRGPHDEQRALVLQLTLEVAALLGRPERLLPEQVVIDADFLCGGYGLIDEGVVEAMKTLARTDGVLLDPVYTGKTMRGLIALAERGAFDGQTVVFIHTGGSPALFGYLSELEGKL